MRTVGIVSTDSNRHAIALAETLARQGHHVVTHALSGSTLDDAGPAADKLASEWGLDHPMLVTCYGEVAGLAALAARRQASCPPAVVLRFDGLAISRHRYLGSRGKVDPSRVGLERAICRSADHVLARCTTEAADLYRLGVPRDRVTIVPDGIDLDTYTPDGPACAKTNQHRLVTIAPPGLPLQPHFGIDTTIAALRKLPETELVVIGGPTADELDHDAEVTRLRALADRAKVNDRVHLRGALPPTSIPQVLRSADIAISVPAYLPYGTAVLEAMACGKPVIATPITGQRDMVTADNTGMFVRTDEPGGLTEAIRTILTTPLLLEGYGLAARKRAETRHNWHRIADETIAAYTLLPEPSAHLS